MKRRTLLAAISGVTASLAGCGSDEWVRGSTPNGTIAEVPGARSSDTPAPGTESSRTATRGSGAPTATDTTVTPSLFDRVLDAVDDVGCDPTGEEACDTAIERAATDGTLIEFPAGTYSFDRGLRFHDVERLGFEGVEDVTFVPPEGFNDKLIGIIGGQALFRGIDVDVTAADTTAGLRFITHAGFEVADVEFLGRGTHPDEAVVNALALAVMDPSKRGSVRNVVARRGSAIGHYKGGNGRVGIWVGERHNGEIRIEDCHLEEFGNNGIYASRCLGSTAVIGGVYRNNNASSVRVGAGGSVIRGTSIEIDLERYGGPDTRTESDYNTRAIVVEQGEYDRAGRALIDDCDVRLRSVDRSQGGIVVWSTGNGPQIQDCRISIEDSPAPAIRAQTPTARVDPGERAVQIRGTTITGGTDDGSAIELRERPRSTIEHATIEQTGADRDGIRLLGSDRCTITSSSVTTARYPILARSPADRSSQCLAYVDGETRLERSGPDLESLRSTELASSLPEHSPGTSEPASGIDGYCLGEAILSELASPASVGITAIRDGSVYWVDHSSIETASDD